MKKFASILLALVLCAVLCVPAFAENEGTWSCKILNNGSVEITGYQSEKIADVTTPQMIDGHPVVGIASSLVQNYPTVRRLVISDAVKYIKEMSFAFCENLESVYIGDGVEKIYEGAFINCEKLHSITIGKNVQDIENYAFAQCPNLKSVTIPENVDSIGEYAFGYIENENEIQKLEGFIICGKEDSEAQKYAEENGFTFVSCAHDTLICKDCGKEYTREELLTQWCSGAEKLPEEEEDQGLLGSTLSEGSLAIVFCVACFGIGFLAAMFVFKKKKQFNAEEE